MNRNAAAIVLSLVMTAGLAGPLAAQMEPDDLPPGYPGPMGDPGADPAEQMRQRMERLQQRRAPTHPPTPAGTDRRRQIQDVLRQRSTPTRRPTSRGGSRGGDTAIILEDEEKKQEGKPDEGQLLRMDLRGLDVHEVFKIFSQQTGMNIVAGAKVRGKATLYLKGVDLWDAFDAVLESNDLAYVRKGDVIEVISAPEYEKLYGRRVGASRRIEVVRLEHADTEPVSILLDSIKSKQGEILLSDWSDTLILVDTPEGIAAMKKALEAIDTPSETKVFVLNYAKVEDVVAQIKPLVSPTQGSIQADARTNRILVKDSPRRIEDIARIVEAFDVPHKEVLIEAKIVQVSLGDAYQFGVNWNYVFDEVNKRNITASVLSTLQVIPTGGQGSTDAETKGTKAVIGSIPPNEFTATLSMLKTVGETNLLSSPRIMALNGQEAKILVGTKEAFVTTTVVNPGGSGVTTTSEQVTFVDVGIQLFVTPIIGEDGFITMKVKPEVSSVNNTITTSQGNSIPIVRTSQAETSVMIQDGTTLVIGGLIEDRKEKNVNRVPILSRIPLLGFFFKSVSEQIRKSELVIFLTPRIVTGAAKIKEARVR
ncbi:MAG: secretin N-terminal domain-containing protein [Elusimicrobiota bacterium]